MSYSEVSGGLFPGDGYTLASSGYNSLASGGYMIVGNGLAQGTANISPQLTASQSSQLIPPATYSQINSLVSSKDPFGHTLVPTPSGGYTDLGASNPGNYALSQLGANSVLSKNLSNINDQSFTGADLKLLIQTQQNTNSTNSGVIYTQLVQCHTISVSSYRVKNPVRSLGYTNPKGFSRGPRTIAGTMVLTEMNVDVLLTFLQSVVIADKSMNSNMTKTDQLPPFNITMIFANEEGAASFRTLIGVELQNDGTVYSVQDLLIERTISWIALDFTPLLPLDTSSLFQANINNTQTPGTSKTPASLMQQASNNSDTIPTSYGPYRL